jgi:hypothetical protein
MNKLFFTILTLALALSSCKKQGCIDPYANNYNDKAQKDDGTCQYDAVEPSYTIPTTYNFVNANNQSTVDYSGQTDRLNQLSEIIDRVQLGKTQVINAQDLKDMFSNVGGDGNGNFTFSSSKQLKDKCFALDTAYISSLFDSVAVASQSFNQTASNGQAGVLSSGTSSYLIGANGMDFKEVIEKMVMGSVFMYQALNVYFGSDKMGIDNTIAVDASAGKYYTQMEHHFDEAFGYFGVPIDYPNNLADDFWGEYCNKQDANLGSNNKMMSAFLRGRAAISAKVLADRNASIITIRKTWEDIAANQAITYINTAISLFGNDQARYMHVLSEVYGFAYTLRYCPESTRRMSNAEHTALMALFGNNFWDITVQDLNSIKAALLAKY